MWIQYIVQYLEDAPRISPDHHHSCTTETDADTGAATGAASATGATAGASRFASASGLGQWNGGTTWGKFNHHHYHNGSYNNGIIIVAIRYNNA